MPDISKKIAKSPEGSKSRRAKLSPVVPNPEENRILPTPEQEEGEKYPILPGLRSKLDVLFAQVDNVIREANSKADELSRMSLEGQGVDLEDVQQIIITQDKRHMVVVRPPKAPVKSGK